MITAKPSYRPRLQLLSTLPPSLALTRMQALTHGGPLLVEMLQAGEQPMPQPIPLHGMLLLVKLLQPRTTSPLANAKVVLVGRRKKKTTRSPSTSISLRRRKRKPSLCLRNPKHVRPMKAQMVIFGKMPSPLRKAKTTPTLPARCVFLYIFVFASHSISG